jgi:hypothetical protein
MATHRKLDQSRDGIPYLVFALIREQRKNA